MRLYFQKCSWGMWITLCTTVSIPWQGQKSAAWSELRSCWSYCTWCSTFLWQRHWTNALDKSFTKCAAWLVQEPKVYPLQHQTRYETNKPIIYTVEEFCTTLLAACTPLSIFIMQSYRNVCNFFCQLSELLLSILPYFCFILFLRWVV